MYATFLIRCKRDGGAEILTKVPAERTIIDRLEAILNKGKLFVGLKPFIRS